MIVNPSKTSPLTLRLSASDALTLPQGGGMTFNESSAQRTIGRWLHLGATTVTVPPYHILYIPISLHVPASTRPGEYEGAISATDMQSQPVSAAAMHLRIYLNRRCLVLLRVPGHASAGLQVLNAALIVQGHTPLLSFALHNNGTVTDYPVRVTATIGGRGRIYRLQSSAGEILGGDATTVLLPLTQPLTPGVYSVDIHIAYLAYLTGAVTPQHLQVDASKRLALP
jgi:hypothetical protein